MIVVTGTNGFIGGALKRRLEAMGERVISFDIKGEGAMHPQQWSQWWLTHKDEIDCVYHMGAITDTTIQDKQLFDSFNLNFSKIVFISCTTDNIPLIYASSAAVYGDGSQGFDDRVEDLGRFTPLNPYAHSKLEFDKFALQSRRKPPFWAGLRFFNVYGYDESHKGRMASMAYHIYNQILETNSVKLFDLEIPPMRDFIYVEDVVDVMLWMMDNCRGNGIYNVGTGCPESFLDLTLAIAKHLDTLPVIDRIPMPADLKDQYQQYTKANISKLRDVGYPKTFSSIIKGTLLYTRILNAHHNITI